jgi:hypothetical protein
MQVEGGEGDRADGLLDPGDRSDPDRALAAQHQGDAVALDQGVGDALGRRLDRLLEVGFKSSDRVDQRPVPA